MPTTLAPTTDALDTIPPPDAVAKKLSYALNDVSILKRLLRLSQAAERERARRRCEQEGGVRAS